MTTTDTRRSAAPAAAALEPPSGLRESASLRAFASLSGPGGLVLTVLVLAAAAVAVVAGLSSGPLWLDEAQSVAIARLPLTELPQALREDGAPPLYYVLLHAWIAVAGDSALAVRLPSVVLAGLALVLTRRLGRRIGGPAAGRAALIVLASMPWWARYATETRMYMLVVVLVLAGAFALSALRARPSPAAFAATSACTAALLLTHYWSLFLLTVIGAAHLRGLVAGSRADRRVVAAMAVGALAFLPWMPSLVFQLLHTGAPWAGKPAVEALLGSPGMWTGGAELPRAVLTLAYVALAVVAVRAAGPARVAAGLVALSLLLAWLSTQGSGGAYVSRYTAIVVPAVVMVLALGVLRLPALRQLPVLAAVAALGLLLGGFEANEQRTQGGEVAEALRATAAPGDVVAFCPDQLGPSVARLVDDDLTLVTYPALGPADRVNWVDYADRQLFANPAVVAARLNALAGDRQLFVDFAPGYRTYDLDCQLLLRQLTELRGEPALEVPRARAVAEEHRLYRFPGG
jgi:mannosyltransferase